MMYKTTNSVAIIIFNRVDKAQRLYNILKKVQPQKLFVIADGPRNNAEAAKCKQTRSVFEKTDWPCTIERNYSETNLGCGRRISSGLNWVFQNVDQAILLEDDCVPSIDFFRFCDEMLERYKNDSRIMQISGTNLMKQWDADGDSYFFAQWASCWGWATWARAWKLFDFDMKTWKSRYVKKLTKQKFGNLVYNNRKKKYDAYCYRKVPVTTWARQWAFARTIHGGLSITPTVNLITNVGDGNDATHTSNMGDLSVETLPMKFPLCHPVYMMPDCEFDRKMVEKVYGIKPLYKKVFSKIKRLILEKTAPSPKTVA